MSFAPNRIQTISSDDKKSGDIFPVTPPNVQNEVPSYQKFFVAVFLLAAANSWSTVFSEAFDYYRPRKGTSKVLIASLIFSTILTVTAIVFARYTYHYHA